MIIDRLTWLFLRLYPNPKNQQKILPLISCFPKIPDMENVQKMPQKIRTKPFKNNCLERKLNKRPIIHNDAKGTSLFSISSNSKA